MIDAERVLALCRERGVELGRPLSVSELTGSTNDDAMDAARSGGPHGATFVAERQTSGRGRRGAVWLSPPGENLTFSVLLRPDLPLGRASALSLAAGLAVRDAVAARVAPAVRVKWPNDVVARDKKLAGILIESQITAETLDAVVAGIGINVGMLSLPDPIAELATSLALLGASDLDRESLLVDVLGALETRLESYRVDGLAGMLEELCAHDALRGRRVRAESAGELVTGVARGIDANGSLLVDDDSGRRHGIVSGTVRLA